MNGLARSSLHRRSYSQQRRRALGFSSVAAAIGDPQRLSLKLWVNDVLKQDSNTSLMIFTLAEQISHLSSVLTLEPGDVILTGTPAGVGAERGEFLKRGDTIRIEIEKLGTLVNRIT